jgi:hypothetical protein
VVDAVVILAAHFLVHPYRQRYAPVALAFQVIVVETIVLAVYRNPHIVFVALRVAEVIDYDFGDAGMVGVFPFGATELDDRVGWRVAVFEDQSGNDQVLAREPQVRKPKRISKSRHSPSANTIVSPGFAALTASLYCA